MEPLLSSAGAPGSIPRGTSKDFNLNGGLPGRFRRLGIAARYLKCNLGWMGQRLVDQAIVYRLLHPRLLFVRELRRHFDLDAEVIKADRVSHFLGTHVYARAGRNQIDLLEVQQCVKADTRT